MGVSAKDLIQKQLLKMKEWEQPNVEEVSLLPTMKRWSIQVSSYILEFDILEQENINTYGLTN